MRETCVEFAVLFPAKTIIMLPRHTLLALSLLIALGTVAHGRAPYYSNGYSQSQYDSNRGDGRYGHRDGISYGGYGNSNADADGYGRPALDIGVPASQPPVCRGDVTVTEGLIIDIRLSDELGADLLSGVNEQSFEVIRTTIVVMLAGNELLVSFPTHNQSTALILGWGQDYM